MDNRKCEALKAELATQPEPQIVSIERFFDGNEDPGSIGCNLIKHPGVETFRDVLSGLLLRPDVDGVYAQISELDPGEENWPFTDTVLVVGAIPSEELREAVSVLQPDEVGPAMGLGVGRSVAEKHGSAVSILWWD